MNYKIQKGQYGYRIHLRKSQIINTIEQLSAEEYDLLHRKYIQGFDLVAIAKKRGKSYSWATTVHSQALKHLQAILDARGEEE